MDGDRDTRPRPEPEGFAHRFTSVLGALNLSRGAAAQALGVDKSVISRWASGAAVPTGHNLSRLTALVQRSWPHFTQSDWQVQPGMPPAGPFAAPAEPPAYPDLPDRPSIAVLPFVTMGGEPGHEYFGDGITEDIITALSKFRYFIVIARSTTFTYKGRSVDIVQVGRELGVRHVLEGSVRRSGGRVRVTAQLIDAATGAHVWAERYDRELVDVFAVQDELTSSVVGAIGPALARSEAARAVARTPDQMRAWDHLMRGMWHFEQLSDDGIRTARACFMRALELDPLSADAHTWIGRTWLVATANNFTGDRRDCWTRAAAAGRRALAIDPEHALAHYVVGMAASWAGETQAALEHASLALELNPNLALAYAVRGIALSVAGRYEEAHAELDSALRLSPNDSHAHVWTAFRATTLYLQGDNAGAIHWARLSAGRRWFYRSKVTLAAALAQSGRTEEARAVIAELLAQDSGEKSIAASVAPFFDAAARARLADGLRKAGMPETD